MDDALLDAAYAVMLTLGGFAGAAFATLIYFATTSRVFRRFVVRLLDDRDLEREREEMERRGAAARARLAYATSPPRQVIPPPVRSAPRPPIPIPRGSRRTPLPVIPKPLPRQGPPPHRDPVPTPPPPEYVRDQVRPYRPPRPRTLQPIRQAQVFEEPDSSTYLVESYTPQGTPKGYLRPVIREPRVQDPSWDEVSWGSMDSDEYLDEHGHTKPTVDNPEGTEELLDPDSETYKAPWFDDLRPRTYREDILNDQRGAVTRRPGYGEDTEVGRSKKGPRSDQMLEDPRRDEYDTGSRTWMRLGRDDWWR